MLSDTGVPVFVSSRGAHRERDVCVHLASVFGRWIYKMSAMDGNVTRLSPCLKDGLMFLLLIVNVDTGFGSGLALCHSDLKLVVELFLVIATND